MLPVIRNKMTMTPWTTPIDRLGRLFDGLFEDSVLSYRPDGAGVPMSLWQDDDFIYVEADLPGMSDQDVEVTVHKSALFLRGERKVEESRPYLYNGRAWGRFEQVITLPEEVKADEVQAELTQGVLRVTLPKSPQSKPRKIALSTN